MQAVLIPACYRCNYIALFVLLLAVPVYAHERSQAIVQAESSRPYASHLQSLLDAAVRQGLPGVSLRAKGPGIDFNGTAGVANLITGEALTTNHVIYAASIGKTFTASLALQLYDEGRLDLDSPITAWLDGDLVQRIPSSEKITLRHLLSHTSGLIDYMNDQKPWRSVFVRDPHRRWSHRDVITYIYDKPLLFEPGSNFHYSNSNYILAGLIIEQVTRQSLHTLMRQRIIVPLGLQHTYSGGEADSSAHRAHGYVNWRGRIIDTFPWYSHYGLADSGIHSTPAELAVFIRSLFNTEMILSERMRAHMTQASAVGWPPSEYGMGIYVQHNPWGAGQRWYAHDGIDPGYQADIMYLPELDLTIVLAANASLGEADVIYEKLITAVVEVTLNLTMNNR